MRQYCNLDSFYELTAALNPRMTFLFLVAFLCLTGVLPVAAFVIVAWWRNRKTEKSDTVRGQFGGSGRGTSARTREPSVPADHDLSQGGKRPNRVWAAVQLLFVAFVAIQIAREVAIHRPGPVSSRLELSLLEYPRDSISLNEFTNFDWSEVLMFPEYSRRAGICTELRLGGLECWWIAPAKVTEGELFLVFLHEKRVVHSEFHLNRNGYFEIVYPVARYVRDVKFKVESGRNNGPPTLRRIGVGGPGLPHPSHSG